LTNSWSNWRSGTGFTSGTLVYTLDQPYLVGEVRIRPTESAPTTVTVETTLSDTGDDDWVATSAGAVDLGPTSLDTWTSVPFTPVEARRVRLTMTMGSYVKISEVEIEAVSEPRSISSLVSLRVAGEMVAGFNAGTLAYDVAGYGYPGEHPTVTAIAADDAASVVIEDLAGPRRTVVTVTAEDGQAQTVYTITFPPSYYPPSVSVSVGGQVGVRRVLSAVASADVPVDSWSYQWLADGVPIAGATGSSYMLQSVDMCRVVTVEASARVGDAVGVGVGAAPGVLRFADVGESHPQYGPLCWMAQAGISTGTVRSDGSAVADPGAPVNRRVAVTWLYRLAGAPAPLAAPSVTPFYDVYVEDGDTYLAALWLWEQSWNPWWDSKYTSPRTGNELRWLDLGATVSRAELAEMLNAMAAAARLHGAHQFVPDGLDAFTDVLPWHDQYEAISWLRDSGITTGNANGSFLPASPVYRQVFAAFAYRYANPAGPTAP
jgi:hypothetical protein